MDHPKLAVFILKLKIDKKEAVLFLIIFTSFSYPFYNGGWDGWNSNSRLSLTYSMVYFQTFNIDNYHEKTGDKSFYNGHYYSDKAPGISFLAVPIYLLVWPLDPVEAYYLKLITISLISAIFAVLFYRFLGNFTQIERYKAYLVIAFALGTIIFPYSTFFYGHITAMQLIFAGFYFIFKTKNRSERKQLAFAGLSLGYAFITEYPTIIISVILFIYLVKLLGNKKSILYFILGALPPILLLAFYNTSCFGSPFATGYSYLATPDEPHQSGVSQTFFGLKLPTMTSIYGISFSPYRGLFLFSCFLLLAIPGFYYLYQQKKWRNEFWLFLSIFIAYFVWNTSYFYWHGGSALGPRHIIPALPFLVIPIIYCLVNWNYKKRLLCYLLFLISIIMILIGCLTDPTPPDDILNPYSEYIFQRFVKGLLEPNIGHYLGYSGLYSIIPLIMTLIGLFLVFFHYTRSIPIRDEPFDDEVNLGV